MIRNDAEMQQNIELIESMYRAIARLRKDIAPQSQGNFRILAEGPVEQIRRLRREIDEYLGIHEPTTEGSESNDSVAAL